MMAFVTFRGLHIADLIQRKQALTSSIFTAFHPLITMSHRGYALKLIYIISTFYLPIKEMLTIRNEIYGPLIRK